MDGTVAALLAAQTGAVVFTLLATACSGAAAALAVLMLTGRAPQARTPLSIGTLVLGAAALIALLARFQRIERFFNAFAHLTSPLSQSLIALVLVMALVAVILFLARRDQKTTAALPVALFALVVLGGIAQGRLLCSSSQIVAEAFATSAHMLATTAMLGCACAALASLAPARDAQAAPLRQRPLGGIVAASGAVMLLASGAILAIRATTTANSLGAYTNPVTFTADQGPRGDFVSLATTGDLAPIFWVGIAFAVVCILLGLVLLLRKGSPAEAETTVNGRGVVALCAAAAVCTLCSSATFQLVYLVASNLDRISLFS